MKRLHLKRPLFRLNVWHQAGDVIEVTDPEYDHYRATGHGVEPESPKTAKAPQTGEAK